MSVEERSRRFPLYGLRPGFNAYKHVCEIAVMTHAAKSQESCAQAQGGATTATAPVTESLPKTEPTVSSTGVPGIVVKDDMPPPKGETSSFVGHEAPEHAKRTPSMTGNESPPDFSPEGDEGATEATAPVTETANWLGDVSSGPPAKEETPAEQVIPAKSVNKISASAHVAPTPSAESTSEVMFAVDLANQEFADANLTVGDGSTGDAEMAEPVV